jgi:hypothetical protein
MPVDSSSSQNVCSLDWVKKGKNASCSTVRDLRGEPLLTVVTRSREDARLGAGAAAADFSFSNPPACLCHWLLPILRKISLGLYQK